MKISSEQTSLGIRGTRSVGRRMGVLLVALTAVHLTGLVSHSFASARDQPSGLEPSSTDAIRLSEVRVPALASSDGLNASVAWAWPSGRRIYQLAGKAAPETVVAFDADTFIETGRQALSPPPWWLTPADSRNSSGQPLTMAVDDAGGRLFVVYQTSPPVSITGFGVGVNEVESCDPLGQEGRCAGGVHVLDAGTLELLKSIPLSPVRADGGAVVALPRAMSYVPPRWTGDAGKVLMLVEDFHAHPYMRGEGPPRPRTSGSAVHWIAQFDPARGVQDWAIRVDACRSSREPSETGARLKAGIRANPGAIFRSANAVIVGCHAAGQTGTVVRVPVDVNGNPAGLPVRIGDLGSIAGAAVGGRDVREVELDEVAGASEQQQAFYGPDQVFEIVADPAAERVLMRTEASGVIVWWVFDNRSSSFVGTIGIGTFGTSAESAPSGLDPETGRLYQLVTQSHPRLFVADTRRTPLGQALVFSMDVAATSPSPLSVIPAQRDGGARRVLVHHEKVFRVIEDSLPSTADPSDDLFAGRTLDLDEKDGVTSVSADGAARGYGARVLLLGGLDSAARASLVDPVTTLGNLGISPVSPCTGGNRDVTLGFVGPSSSAVVDASGSRGAAEPVVVDSASRADLEAAASRCSGMDWDALWAVALFGRAPAAEPTMPWPFPSRAAECVAKDGVTSDSVGDPVSGAFTARVECSGGEEASGFAYARGMEVAGVRVAEALSSYRIYRDPGRGIVSRVESVARGVDVGGLVRIEGIRGAAESWANGRRQPVEALQRGPEYAANCDFERTAGTCFQRHLFGLRTPGYSCGPCGDERTFVNRLSRALGANASVRLRDPDPGLSGGAENGFLAAIQKPASERFAELTLNNDQLQTVLPTLEIVRYTTPGLQVMQSVPYVPPRGRQIVQLAGVEVSSSYSIQCLLVYDEEANTCGPSHEPPGSLAVELLDPEGSPLAGGLFEVRSDVDGDGVAGLTDELTAGAACMTAADGIGTCRFDQLVPGRYLVLQAAAPVGYARIAESFAVDLASGETRRVTFTNASDVSVINIHVVDGSGRPVAAAFAVYPDSDADGKVAPGAVAAATCTTDADGTCLVRVRAGSYVLVQTAVPDGLVSIDPVAFTFATGGQTAEISIVNASAGVPASPAETKPTYAPPPPAAAPVVTVDRVDPLPQPVPEAADRRVDSTLGGTIIRVIRAPGDALRLVGRQPLQAAAWTAVIFLLAVAAASVQRRRRLAELALPAGGFSLLQPPAAESPPRTRHGNDQRGTPGRTDVPVRGPRGRLPRDGVSPDLRAAAGVRGPVAPSPREVAGGALPLARPTAVLATASSELAGFVAARLAVDEQVALEVTVDAYGALRAFLVEHAPDVVLADLGLPSEGQDDIVDALARLFPPERIVGLIPPDRPLEAVAQAGYICGYAGLLVVEDDIGNGQLAYAVRCVAAGKPFYGPTVQAALLDRWGGRGARKTWRAAGLSPREVEIARLLGLGFSRSQIAKRLFLSEETVKLHTRAVRNKIGVPPNADRAYLRRRLAEFRLIDEGGDLPGLADRS